MDVVPAGDGWDTDHMNRNQGWKDLCADQSDDKGPSMAAYYAMKIIKELDLKLSKVRFVVGSDEAAGAIWLIISNMKKNQILVSHQMLNSQSSMVKKEMFL